MSSSPLWKTYWWFSRRIAPGMRYAQRVYEERLFAVVEPSCSWLDLGCGHVLLPAWRAAQELELVGRPSRLVGVDPELSALREHQGISLKTCGDGGSLPFADRSFDLVTANMVVEHLGTPEAQFREIARVLKPGGRFVFHTPNATGYPTLLARSVPDPIRAFGARIVERRGDKDRFRTYYRANTPATIREIASTSGFTVDNIELLRSTAMFPMVLPVALVELVLLRALAADRLSWLRPNIIAVLRRSA